MPDRQLASVLMLRLWVAATGLVSAYVITSTLDPAQAGRLYVLLTLTSAIAFFDFGLNATVTQSCAASRSQDSDTLHMQGTFQAARRKSRQNAAAYFLGLAFALAYQTANGNFLRSEFALLLISLGAIGALWLSANVRIAVAEGTGHVAKAALARMASTTVLAATLCLALLSGIGIWSVPLSQGAGAAALYASIRQVERRHAHLARHVTAPSRGEILDFSLKKRVQVTLSAATSHLTLNLPVFFIAKTGQLELAAQLAVLFQFASTAVGLAISPLSSKFHVYCKIAKNQNIAHLKELHSRRTLSSWAILIPTLAFAAFALNFLTSTESPLKIPRPPLELFFVAGISALAVHHANCSSIILQALGNDRAYLGGVARTAIFCLVLFFTSFEDPRIQLLISCVASCAASSAILSWTVERSLNEGRSSNSIL